MTVHRLEIEAREGLPDPLAAETSRRLEAWLGLNPARIRTRRVYHFDLGLTDAEAGRVRDALVDPIAEVGALGILPDPDPSESPWIVTVGLLPGVTDSVGKSVKRAVEDCLGRALAGQVYSSVQYVVWGLSEGEMERASREVLYNPLIQQARTVRPPRRVDRSVPRAGSGATPEVQTVALRQCSNDELIRISSQGTLALSLPEMRTIAIYFRGLGRDPTDAELECLAQTWSEHCKHKIFAAPIDYIDPNGNHESLPDGLFERYIRGATDAVAAARGGAGVDGSAEPFLVSVFHDNAGVVRFSDTDHLVYKVETHNSPSALDPYGGALTGIVGVNRDSFGTGVGADLLANVWGYCFGPPNWSEPLPPGLMPPRRIREGVHHGVVDGGNQSGIPYMRGWELFDRRYAGKPLVFCGTVAVMPVKSAGRPTHIKRTAVGDKIVMVGGRIGKDGIHGATFSSVELDESSPVQAVQLGDPITQKMMWDMLTEARDRGLYSGMTDNGAGGLSSSIGEMAEATGGARIDLSLAPLKYPGLAPWEILISEAQERMSLAIPPHDLEAFLDLCRRREVEATVLGEFTDTGRFEVTFGNKRVVDLSLDFLHEGLPRVTLSARWDPPPRGESKAEVPGEDGLESVLLGLLARPGIASHERYARHYDHEVKGLSVVKPFIGVRRDVPATATVMRGRHGRSDGVVLAEGVHPFYGDVDTLHMARASMDEAVRRVLCAGARYDRLCALDNFCWPDPVRSDKTPDGEHKLAQLVRCCQGLRQACEAYGVPLVSGKDSMKNDATLGGIKISIPPTLLVSVMGQMVDVSRALTLRPRGVGDILMMVGETRAELGGSEVMRALGMEAESVPRTDLAHNAGVYPAFVAARDAGIIRSAHALGRGGLALAAAHMAMAAELGVDVSVDPLDLAGFVALFAESTGRVLVTVAPGDQSRVETDLGAVCLGIIAPARDGAGWLRVSRGGQVLVDLSTGRMRQFFQEEGRCV